MEIKTYRVPQVSSKRTTVVCVNGVPICSVRGASTLSKVISRLEGYGTDTGDGRVNGIIDGRRALEASYERKEENA